MTVRTQKALTLLDAMEDPALFGPWFQGAEWNAWRVFLSALFGLQMDHSAVDIFRRHTGRQHAPETPATEAWLVVGRRGGKSLISALVAVYLACFRDYRNILAPGERGTVMVIAADRRQARVVFRYITGFLEGVPMLAQMLESQTKEAITLSNRVTIEVHTANFRAVRGYTVVAAICDEIAFWRSEESVTPDKEILNGLRPGMATVPDPLLLCISSPYARRGALWEAYQHHFGKDDDQVLVWQADTRSMNPSVPDKVIDEAYAADPESASAEYAAQFRRDIESFVSAEAIDAAIVIGRYELPPITDVRYQAFADPSGGSQDSFTLAIAHYEKWTAVLDCVREKKPPFSPEAVVGEFCDLLKQYRISQVSADRYAGEWPREQFRKQGVEYVPAEKTKSELYLELLPAINSGKVELLDDRRLISQLAGLERHTSRSGRDTVDHPPGAHDDLANAAAGALLLAAKLGKAMIGFPTAVQPDLDDDEVSSWHWVGASRWRWCMNQPRLPR